MDMEAVNWKRWIGEYQDRLSAPSKTHLTEDGKITLCGKEIPVYEDCYEVEGQAAYNADCKKCVNKAA
jgi:hypothetical protein